jgi:hypothetical protein
MAGSTRSEERRATAAEALSALGWQRSSHELLVVQCRRSHHLAQVVDTHAGPVVVSRTGAHGHGRKDLPDLGEHGAAGGAEFVDLLRDPLGGDDFPAWCDCGPRRLSRTWVLEQLRSGERTAHV